MHQDAIQSSLSIQTMISQNPPSNLGFWLFLRKRIPHEVYNALQYRQLTLALLLTNKSYRCSNCR